MENKQNAYPSNLTESEVPYGWVQWKGTDVCIDLHCKCGALCHFDGDFCYHVKCAHCNQVYEVDGHVKLHPLDFEPENTHLVADDYYGK